MEKLVIASGADAAAWAAAEATMTSTAERTKTGEAALRFHIDVDHHAGEKAYPIGWPRVNRPFNEDWQRDWSGFDFVRFWILVDTSREKLPSPPAGLILYTPDKSRAYHKALSELRKGEWVKIEIPISKIARHENVTRIQIFISESSYKDHDVVDFFVDDICLLRYAEPHLSDVALRPSIAFAGNPSIIVGFRATGILADAPVEARVLISRDGRRYSSTVKSVRRGANEVVCDIGAAEMSAGEYEVRVQLQGAEDCVLPLRLVESPWAE